MLGPYTTVGREDCHLIIQTLDIDPRHAVIEFDVKQEEFVLQDWNSTHGTFVNDVHIKDAAVPLSNGDFVKFGHLGSVFQFICDIHKKVSQCLPLEMRPNYLATHPKPPQVIFVDGLPQLRSMTVKQRRPGEEEEEETKASMENVDPDDASRWIIGPRRTGECDDILNKADETPENMKLAVTCLKEEVKRLTVFESESMFKDDFIDQLKNEVAYLQMKLRQFEVGSRDIVTHDDLENCESVISPLQLTEKVSQEMVDEQPDVVEQMSAEAEDPLKEMTSSAVLLLTPSQLLEGMASNSSNVKAEDLGTDVHASTHERDCVARSEPTIPAEDLCAATLLLAILKKNLLIKDETIKRLAREGDCLRQYVTDQAACIASMKKTLDALCQDENLTCLLAKQEKEIALLQHRLNFAKTKQTELKAEVNSLKSEVQECKKTAETEKTTARKLMLENGSSLAKIRELERLDQVSRVEIEQLTRRLERFRGQLFQVTQSHPTVKSANKMVYDDELVEILKKCYDQIAAEEAGRQQQIQQASVEELPKKEPAKKEPASRKK